MSVRSKGTKKIRKGDKVVVLSGNYAGQVGNVLRSVGSKVVVQGVNVVKKHVKKTQDKPQGAILTLEKPIAVSNVMLCVGEDKPVKLKVKTDNEGKRYLYYQDGNQEVVYRYIKSKT